MRLIHDVPKSFHFWNGALLVSGVLAFFFLLTNGVPLTQLGWLPLFPNKGGYLTLMRIFLSLFFILFFFLYVRHRKLFNDFTVVNFVSTIVRHRLTTLLLILTSAYIAIMSMVSILRHLCGRGGDVAIFDQALWNGTQGDFLYSSIKNGICVLGDHMSPVLALIIPLYKIWPDPIMTFILQAITIGMGLYITGWLAREKLKSNFLAIVFALIYFFNFHARATLHYEFHPEALVEPFMFLAFICAERKKMTGFFLCLFMIALGKENMLGVTFILGFYVFAFNSWRIAGLVTMALSVVIFLFEIKWLIPHLSGIPYQYGYYGEAKINWVDAFEYFVKIFAPVAFLSLFHPASLILTFPILFQNMFSANELMRSPSRHYTIGLHPFLFISAIYGFYSLCRLWPFFERHKKVIVCAVLWISLLRSGPSEYYHAWNFIKAERPYDNEMLDKIKEIGPEYSVLTQADFLTRLINRHDLYVLDGRTPPTQEVINRHKFDRIVFNQAQWPLPDLSITEALSNLKQWGYSILFEKNGFYILGHD